MSAVHRKGGSALEHDDLSVPHKVKGSESQEELLRDPLYGGILTLYERKSLLVQRELDLMGLGRYQKCIWLLCGFGYFLDLLVAQALGLVATPIYQELNVTGGDQTTIFSAFSAGLTVGALFWGLSADIIGRKWAFNLTCLITSTFCFLIAAPSNFNAICALTAFCGFGLGGNIPIDATITLEFLPNRRRWLLPLLSMWQPIGVVVCSGLAYALVPRYRCAVDLPACRTVADGVACCTLKSNIGWRYLMITLGSITLGVFILRFAVFKFHESPKFLLSKGRDAEAVAIVHKIAAFNRQPPPALSLAEFEALDAEYPEADKAADRAAQHGVMTVLRQSFRRFAHLKTLFRSKKLAFTTVLLLIVFAGDFWSFNLAGAFLPIILARRGVDAGVSVTETYRQYVYIYLPGILGTIFAALMIDIPRVGRKYTLIFGALVQGVAMAMYTQVDTLKALVGLNALEYIAQSFFNAVLYGAAPEFYESGIRGSAVGMLSTFGRLSGIVAPFAARPYIDGNSSGVLWLACGGIWLAAFALLFLPVETRGKPTY